MKSIAIVRSIDKLGRLCLPKELRDTRSMKIKSPIEIFVEGDMIILRKYVPECILCGNDNDLKNFKGRLICRECINNI